MADDRKPQKPRVDSPSSVAAAVLAAGRIVRTPSGFELDAEETAIFAEIVAEIPKVELSDHQVRVAAMLARTIWLYERDVALLTEEGNLVPDRHGIPMLNPRVKAVQQFATQVLSYRRSLGLTSRALAGGDSRRVAISRAHNLASEHLLDNDDEDDLLARPPSHVDPDRAH